MKTEAIGGDWAGRVIDGKYPLLRWLGGTESNGVFLTEIEGDPARKAAIRLVAANSKEAGALMARWAEASALAHPNLTRLMQTGKCQSGSEQLIYAVTEYAEENLSEILPVRPLTAGETGEMLDPVLNALSYLHGKGLVHGRLRPSNVLVVNDQVKLSIDDVQSAGALGKRDDALDIHDAPECAAGTISPAADLWSLGVLMVETLTQRPPVWDRTAQSDPVVPQSMPEPFAGIALECLHAEPARRCTLGEVGERLKGPRTQQKSSSSEWDKAYSTNLRFPLIVVAAVVAIVLIAILFARSHRTEPQQAAVEQAPAQQQSETAIKPSAAVPAPVAETPKPAAASPAPEMQSQQPVAPVAHSNSAAVVEQVLPEVLPTATASIHGQFVVKVRVSVDAAGSVTDASFDSQGPSKYFAKAALEAARRWRFKPAAASAWLIEFRFRRDGTEVTPVQVAR